VKNFKQGHSIRKPHSLSYKKERAQKEGAARENVYNEMTLNGRSSQELSREFPCRKKKSRIKND